MELKTADSSKPYRKEIGRQLAMAREQQGWSIEQVATMADMKPATIEKIESGRYSFPLDIIWRVADVLGQRIVIEEKDPVNPAELYDISNDLLW